VLVRTGSDKVLKDGKRYHLTGDGDNGMIELNSKSNFKLSQSFISEYNFFKVPGQPSNLGLRKSLKAAKKKSRDLKDESL